MPVIPSLTGLRFLAALSVAFGHGVLYFFNTRADQIPIGQIAIIPAGFGMSCFFVLSGFVIQYNYRDVVGSQDIKQVCAFYIARFARLFPLFIFLFIFELLFGGFLKKYLHEWPVDRHAWQAIPFHILFVQSWFYDIWGGNIPIYQFGDVGQVSWSISTEWGFYLLFPFISLALSRFRGNSAYAALLGLLLLCVLAPVLCYGASDKLNGFAAGAYGVGSLLVYDPPIGLLIAQDSFVRWLYYFSPYVRCLEFAFGCALAECWMRGTLPRERWHGAALGAATAGAVVICVAVQVPLRRWPAPMLGWLFISAFGFALPVGVVLWRAALRDGVFRRVLSSRPALIGGEASYGIYLLHLPVFKAIGTAPLDLERDQILRHAAAFLLGLLITVGLAIFLQASVERPARQWLRAKLAPGGTVSRRTLRWCFAWLCMTLAATATAAALPFLQNRGAPREGITVIAAAYGANCRPRDASAALRQACTGQEQCDYTVDVAILGDPAPGCAKEFAAAWICGTDARIRRLRIPAEAGLRSTASLRCGPD